MDTALNLLTISQMCSQDQLFVFQVRIQLLKQKAQDLRLPDEMDVMSSSTESASRLIYLKTLRRELQELQSSVPSDIPQIGA